MAQISRYKKLEYAHFKIKNYFEKNEKKIFNQTELADVLLENMTEWSLAKITRLVDFINFLKNNEIIKEIIDIKLTKNYTKRYITGNYFDYEIGVTIYKGSYYSHYTALYLHGLTINIPKTIYLNKEQSKKNIKSEKNISQENIDKAFNKPMRRTNQIATFKDCKIYMLNGKNTSKLGIIKMNLKGKNIMISKIERTLIDIVVRPEYSGGVNEIIEAYRLAKENCSINHLLELLRNLNYIYPYHQAIGFYLERAGYKESILKKVENAFSQEFDFYLQYGMKNKEYSKRWRLFFPKGI